MLFSSFVNLSSDLLYVRLDRQLADSGPLLDGSIDLNATADQPIVTGVLASSSIDNASGSSSSVKIGDDLNEEDETRGHGEAVVLTTALAGPDGTGAGVAGAVIPREHQKTRIRKTRQAHKKRTSNSRTKSHSTRDGFN